MRQATGDPAEQEKHNEPDMAERVLDIVPEYPKKQHVEGEMRPVGMQELIGDEGERRRHGSHTTRHSEAIEEPCRDHRIARHCIETLPLPDPQLTDEDHDVEQDQANGDVMRTDVEARVGVMQGYQWHEGWASPSISIGA